MTILGKYMFDNIIQMWDSIIFIIEGSLITLKYSVISVFFGLIIGTLLAVCKTGKYRSLRYFSNFYTSIFRGTPLLIQLSIIYYLAPTIIGIKLSVFVAGVLAFSLNSGAYIAEHIRAGIEAIDKGQIEAGKALGVPQYYIMKDIILPQAIRKMLPSLINELVNMLKESAIISFLGEADLMRRAQVVAAEKFDYFTPIITAAICYYVLVFIFNWLAVKMEKRMAI
jgi:polar amino acid transport system permease protein